MLQIKDVLWFIKISLYSVSFATNFITLQDDVQVFLLRHKAWLALV